MSILKWGVLIFCIIVVIFILTRKLPAPIVLNLCKTSADCPQNSTCNALGLCVSDEFIITSGVVQSTANDAVTAGNNLYILVESARYMGSSQNYSQLYQSLIKLMQTISKYQAQTTLIGYGPNASLSAAINALQTGVSLSTQAMPIAGMVDAVDADFNNTDSAAMKISASEFMIAVNNATMSANNLSLLTL